MKGKHFHSTKRTALSIEILAPFIVAHRPFVRSPPTSLPFPTPTHAQTEAAVVPVGNEPPKQKTTRVIMKFGGSSLANAERVDYVANLIKSQIEKGFRPTVVCSAMGKTTNNLLNAGHFALEGNVYVDSLRTLHLTTAQELGMGNDTIASIEELLDELKNLLNGVSYLRELTPRTLDYLVRYPRVFACGRTPIFW